MAIPIDDVLNEVLKIRPDFLDYSSVEYLREIISKNRAKSDISLDGVSSIFNPELMVCGCKPELAIVLISQVLAKFHRLDINKGALSPDALRKAYNCHFSEPFTHLSP